MIFCHTFFNHSIHLLQLLHVAKVTIHIGPHHNHHRVLLDPFQQLPSRKLIFTLKGYLSAHQFSAGTIDDHHIILHFSVRIMPPFLRLRAPAIHRHIHVAPQLLTRRLARRLRVGSIRSRHQSRKKRIEKVGFVQAVGFDSLRHSIGQHSLHSSPHAVVMKRRKPAAALLKRPGSQFAVSEVQTRYVCQFPFSFYFCFRNTSEFWSSQRDLKRRFRCSGRASSGRFAAERTASRCWKRWSESSGVWNWRATSLPKPREFRSISRSQCFFSYDSARLLCFPANLSCAQRTLRSRGVSSLPLSVASISCAAPKRGFFT